MNFAGLHQEAFPIFIVELLDPIHILCNISRSQGNLTLKLGQLIEYNKRYIFLQKLYSK